MHLLPYEGIYLEHVNNFIFNMFVRGFISVPLFIFLFFDFFPSYLDIFLSDGLSAYHFNAYRGTVIVVIS